MYLFPDEIVEDSRPEVHDLELDGAESPVRSKRHCLLSEPAPERDVPQIPTETISTLICTDNGVNLQLSRRRSQKLLPVKGLAQVPAGLLLLPPAWLPSQDLTMTAAPSYVATQVGNEVVGILVALVADERLDSLGKHFHGDGDLNRRGWEEEPHLNSNAQNSLE